MTTRLLSKMEVWKSPNHSDWKRFMHLKVLTRFPGDTGNRSHVIKSRQKSTRQKSLRSWWRAWVLRDRLSRFGSSSLKRFWMCTSFTHHKAGTKPTLCQQMAWATGLGRMKNVKLDQGRSGAWTDCSVEMKPVSSGKLGPVDNVSPGKGLIL